MNLNRTSTFFLLFVLLFPAVARAEPFLTPAVIDAGGVSLLRWRGEPPAAAAVRFNGRDIPLLPFGGGPAALLGTDLELAPGLYPVTLTVSGPEGLLTYEFVLEVRRPPRPEERLTLPPAMVEPREPAVLQRIARESRLLADLFARDGGAPRWRDFIRPVDDPPGSPFGLRRILNGKPRSPHAGVDFRSRRGTPVRASAAGRVVLADDLYFTGRTVVLDHGAGLFSLYAHLDDLLCAAGDVIEQGGTLGRVGSSGRATGPHLHWGFKLRGDRVDPMAVLSLFAGGKPLDSLPGGGNN
jgi:murein DD-endopeptidase MepM/ murein hydrolase activator NlpD